MQVVTDFEAAVVRTYPERVAIAIARDANGKHNPITLCWLMRTSFDPPMFAMALAQTRYSLAAVRHAREFVVSIPSAQMQKESLYFGTVSGREVDKLAESGVRTQPATRINSVLLTDAVANFECQLESELQAGDHVIVVGRVLAAHTHTDLALRGLYALGEYKFGGVAPI